VRLKKGRKSQTGGPFPKTPQASLRKSSRNLDQSAARSAFPSSASDNADVLVVPYPASDAEVDVNPPTLHLPSASVRTRARRDIAASGGSRRLKLLVHTGSCRIVMTGEVTPEDDVLLPADMRESQDELGLEEGFETNKGDNDNNGTDDGTAGGGEMITVEQFVLLAGDDHVHYSKQHSGMFDNSEGQFV